MPVIAGASFTTTLISPGGINSGVGARVEVPVTRAIVSMFELAVLSAVDGFTWTATLYAPMLAGEYNIIWMTTAPDEAQPGPFPIFVPLFVADTSDIVGITNIDWPPIDMDAIEPSVADVAALEGTRTRDEAGTFYDTFTAQTEPTDAQVLAIIGQAKLLVVSEFPNGVDPAEYSRVKQAVALLSAVMIETSFFRNQESQGGGSGNTAGAWRAMYTMVISGLQADVERALRQGLVMGTMEPRGLV